MPPPLRVWTRATSLGWLLGIPLVVALALAAELVGIGGAQFIVGLGVGLGVGLIQARALLQWMPRRALWTAVSGLGLALPFLVVDLSSYVGRPFEYSLVWCVIIGGTLVGIGQAWLLTPHVFAAPRWILVSAAGWAAAAGVASLADQLNRVGARGALGALAYLGVVAVGGPILGLVTGTGFRVLPPRTPERSSFRRSG